MAEYNIEEFINSYIVEKLAQTYEKDETYMKLLKEADLIYEKLSEELTDDQADLLEKYFEATVVTTARRDTLTYIEGNRRVPRLSTSGTRLCHSEWAAIYF